MVYPKDIPTIDLHGIPDIATSLETLESQLFLFFCEDKNVCRVIYGIGEGLLAEGVLAALKQNPMVITVEQEETGGSAIVTI
ncbi:MAG: Smr/MutS family protein [Candidatus Magasanikbacteria bacterium]|jgi:dsDNA-specific endonuclease/ATPase MutS2|nr:Smr/MutS family protein [Candidatus Magasanikbacteria bacterium]